MPVTLKGLLASAGLAACLAIAAGPASAQERVSVSVTDAGNSSYVVPLVLPLNKSSIVELGRPAADVIISNPAVADVFVQTGQRLIFRGVSTGKTNAFIFDRNGVQIANLEITVEQDVADLEVQLARIVPEARVTVEGVYGNIVLSGRVPNMVVADRVIQIARGYLANAGINQGVQTGNSQIVNLMKVDASDQVLLQVRIVEMRRTVAKQLGIDLTLDEFQTGEIAGEDFISIFGASRNTVPIDGGVSVGLGYTNLDGNRFSIDAALQALERVGIVRMLAEPNLTALTGETANFLAGGEFPIPAGIDRDTGAVLLEFKDFGVGLGFTPLVLSEDRISLRLSTEVSDVAPDVAIAGVPGLTTRRVETTVEIPSGKSMMIAGLIQSETRQSLEELPGVNAVPYIGALFRSRDFANEETELVVIVTPFLVDPANPKKFRTPAEGFANPSDLETSLFGRLNAIYGKNERPVDGTGFNAPVGFIEE